MKELKIGNFVPDPVLPSEVIAAGSEESLTPTLVIGDLNRWKKSGHPVPEIDGFEFAEFEQITSETIQSFQPQVILSPLTCQDFDAIDVARRLAEFGYNGCYRVVTNGVPAPDVVKREVNSVAPYLDFGVLQLRHKLKP